MRRGAASRAIAIGALLAAVVTVVGVAVGFSGDGDHRLHAIFGQASHVVPGLDVRAAGQRVGEIVAAETSEGQARLELRVNDDVWPLTEGTTARLRFGGTIALVSRYVELTPGPRDAPEIPEGGLIPASDTISPVEFDRLFRTYDEKTRTDLGRLMDRGGPAFSRAGDELAQVLDTTPPRAAQVRALLEDLGDDPVALDTLVRSGDRMTNAVASSRPGLRELVADAASTFDALASRATAIEQTLARSGPTLKTARGTLARANDTLSVLDDLAQRLRPGIRRLRELTGPASSVLHRLTDVGPTARRALATARSSSPDLAALLAQATPLMHRIASVSRQGAEQLRCVRPYVPEIAGTISTLASALAFGDANGKYVRVHANQLTYDPGADQTPEELIEEHPFITYAFPAPPGFYAGQPWFIPSCGVGPETVDPAQDPEARTPEGANP